jgi:hypothetical protein
MVTPETIRKLQAEKSFEPEIKKMEAELLSFAANNPSARKKGFSCDKNDNYYREYFQARGFGFSWVNNNWFDISW